MHRYKHIKYTAYMKLFMQSYHFGQARNDYAECTHVSGLRRGDLALRKRLSRNNERHAKGHKRDHHLLNVQRTSPLVGTSPTNKIHRRDLYPSH